MDQPRSFVHVARLCLAGTAVLAVACAPGNPPTAPSEFGGGEYAVAQAVGRTFQTTHRLYQLAVTATLAGAGALDASGAPGGAVLPGTEDLTCDVSIRYFNAQGQEQVAYDPVTTARVWAKGTCAGSGTSTAVDLTLDDMQWARPSLVANGTTFGTFGNVSVHCELRDLRMPKQRCGYPVGGQVIARVEGISMTVAFHGSATATATYSRSGETATFEIPLPGC